MNVIGELWLVNGWEGDPCVFSNKGKAFSEFHRRLALSEDWTNAVIKCLDTDENSEFWWAYDDGDEYYLTIYLIPFYN